MIGHIRNIKIGQAFQNRRELHDANIHRGLQQGISSDGSSIAMSGGYLQLCLCYLSLTHLSYPLCRVPQDGFPAPAAHLR